jgi:hypothetical protein
LGERKLKGNNGEFFAVNLVPYLFATLGTFESDEPVGQTRIRRPLLHVNPMGSTEEVASVPVFKDVRH